MNGEKDEGISPVIGSILMLAIVVVIAAVALFFLTGIMTNPSAPSAGVTFSQNSSGIVEVTLVTQGTSGTVIAECGGQSERLDSVGGRVYVDSSGCDTLTILGDDGNSRTVIQNKPIDDIRLVPDSGGLNLSAQHWTYDTNDGGYYAFGYDDVYQYKNGVAYVAQQERTIALDIQDGSEVFNESWATKSAGFSTNMPEVSLTYNNTLIYADDDGGVRAIDMSTGSELWHQYIGIGRSLRDIGYTSEGALYALATSSPNDFFMLIDPETGSLIAADGNSSTLLSERSRGGVYDSATDSFYVHNEGNIYSYNSTTGDFNWDTDITPDGHTYTDPVVRGSSVYVPLNQYILEYDTATGNLLDYGTVSSTYYTSPGSDQLQLRENPWTGKVYIYRGYTFTGGDAWELNLTTLDTTPVPRWHAEEYEPVPSEPNYGYTWTGSGYEIYNMTDFTLVEEYDEMSSVDDGMLYEDKAIVVENSNVTVVERGTHDILLEYETTSGRFTGYHGGLIQDGYLIIGDTEGVVHGIRLP